MLRFTHNETLFNFQPHQKHIYILEGPDCCGKTTVAKEIQKMTGYPIWHLRYFSDPEKMQFQFDYIENYLKHWLSDNGDGDGIILDRLILSNQAYQSVFKDGPIVKNAQSIYDFLVNEQTFANVTFVNCIPSDKERWLKFFAKKKEERVEQYDDVEKMSQVYDAYMKKFWDEYVFAFHYNQDVLVRSVFFDLFEEMDRKDTSFDEIEVDMADIVNYR